MKFRYSYSRKSLYVLFALLFCLVVTTESSSLLAADPPLTFERIHLIYKDPQIADLREREQNLKNLIRANKINFVPTDSVKAVLREEHKIPESILDELNRNFASKIQYRLSKFECYGCLGSTNPCEATHHFRYALQVTIFDFVRNRPRIWHGKGVLDGPIFGCETGQPFVDPEEHIVIDLNGEIVRNGRELSLEFKLFQKQLNNTSLFLGTTSTRISLHNRHEGFRDAAVAVKRYVEDVVH